LLDLSSIALMNQASGIAGMAKQATMQQRDDATIRQSD
jgi:hypothetical protein